MNDRMLMALELYKHTDAAITRESAIKWAIETTDIFIAELAKTEPKPLAPKTISCVWCHASATVFSRIAHTLECPLYPEPSAPNTVPLLPNTVPLATYSRDIDTLHDKIEASRARAEKAEAELARLEEVFNDAPGNGKAMRDALGMDGDATIEQVLQMARDLVRNVDTQETIRKQATEAERERIIRMLDRCGKELALMGWDKIGESYTRLLLGSNLRKALEPK